MPAFTPFPHINVSSSVASMLQSSIFNHQSCAIANCHVWLRREPQPAVISELTTWARDHLKNKVACMYRFLRKWVVGRVAHAR
jgi:hypothetical protein